MKKILLMSVPALVFSGTIMAQNSFKAPVIKEKSVANRVAKASKYSAEAGFASAAGAAVSQTRATTTALLGTTTYQLQSNYSVQNRIVFNADGTINTAWIFSATTGWADRGTGYAYNNGTSFSAPPTARIEPVRTGWPSIMVLGDNSEVVIAHTASTTASLHMAKRAVKGTGTWSSSTAISSTAPYGSTWPRACAGGPTGNTIHMIVVSNPTDGAATPTPVYWKGQQGCLTYSRSLDGGVTWDKLHEVPTQHDSTQYRGFGGDTYAIDAKGNVVAYVVGGPLNDLFLMKSLDNGNTWTKTNIMNFPIPFFDDQISDVNGDNIADTIDTNDGTVSLLIDDNDDVHVMFGNMRILNDDSTDSQYSYFPGTLGVMYWNDNVGGTPQMIASAEDVDGDGALTVSDWGTYQNSLTSFTSMGIDNAGKIHAAFAGIVENTDPLGGGKSVRNIYYFSSADHGATWTVPVRIEPNDIQEQVWPSVARRAEPNCIRMIYHGDEAPGHGTTSTNADYADNTGISGEAYYACVDPLVGITETVNLADMISLYPNPAGNDLTVTAMQNITRLELYNSLGELVGSYSPNTTRTSVNVSALKAGLYIVNVYHGTQKISKTMMKD